MVVLVIIMNEKTLMCLNGKEELTIEGRKAKGKGYYKIVIDNDTDQKVSVAKAFGWLEAKDLELIAYRLLGYALNEQSKAQIVDKNGD